MSLVISLVLLGLGIGQRTIWAPPDSIVSQLEESTDAQIVVVTGETMNQHDGRQTVTVSGDGPITAVVGRDHDVAGWVGDDEHAQLRIDDADALSLERVSGPDDALPALAGNDMWIEEHSGDGELEFDIDLPVGFSMAIQGELGTPAPTDIRVEWPFDAKTPLFGPLITAGLVFLALALLLFLLALRRHRRRRGPQRRSHRELSRSERRSLQRDARAGLTLPERSIAPSTRPEDAPEAIEGPDAPEASEPDRSGDEGSAGERGRSELRAARIRRRAGFIAFPVLASIALTGCGPQYWPSPEPSETSASPSPTTLEETLPPVALTESQFERVLADTRESVAQADADEDFGLVDRRLAGPMRDARRTNYAIRGQSDEIEPLPGIPDGEVQLLLPQQTEIWPRTVMAVVAWEDEAQAQSTLVFQQNDPRENYRVVYQSTLASGVQVPAVASPTIGAASLPMDTPLLQHPAQDITMAYADVLLRGDDSEYASWFREEGDAFREQFGRAWKDEQRANPDLELTNLEWFADDDDQEPLMLVTNEGGALLATSYNETQRATPKEDGVEVSAQAGAAVLAGVEQSDTGIEQTYQIQLLFAVPPADAPEGAQIQVVGYAQSLLSAQEVAE
ncbi:hypothetical protein [Agrococcus baldri]|uniref:hypothetical protein n=1 Tax=Agrococcus baldri TaxID=153730 RepID=UPI0011BDAAEB|nr:hypothetical protein [Agrococcus baldri]